jgi:hypothetical protein
MAGQTLPPVTHWPVVLGGLRRLEVATVLARLLPPHPAPVRAAGRGGEAWGRALRDGDHALSQGGRRLDERGMLALLQPGLSRAARQDDRFGPILEALCAAHRTRVLRALVLQALAVYALPTPWLPQETTTLAL